VGLLRRLFGGSGDSDAAAPAGRSSDDEAEWRTAHDATFDATADRHRVTVWLRLVDPTFENEREQQRLFGLENVLMRALDASRTGEHDTNSLEAGYLAIRLVGDDADAIVAVVHPLLTDAPPGSYLAVRRGPAGSAEERLDLKTRAGDAEPGRDSSAATDSRDA
jgi:hypothetical protein